MALEWVQKGTRYAVLSREGTTRPLSLAFCGARTALMPNLGATGSDGGARAMPDSPGQRVSIAAYGGSPSATSAVNTLALQRAMAALEAAGGGTLTDGVAGVYLVNCPSTGAYAGGTMHYAVFMASNVSVDFGKSTFKMADKVTTDAAPIATAIFFSNQERANISFPNATFDMNGAHNRVNGRNLLQAAIAFSGDGAYCDNLDLGNVTVRDTCGSCCVLFSQTNTVGQKVGTKARLRNVHIELVTAHLLITDHSSLSGAVNDCVVDAACTFKADTPRADNVTVAWDAQGTNVHFDGSVENYGTGIQLGGNYTTPTTGVVRGVFRGMTYSGINFYRNQATEQEVRDILLDGLQIELNDIPNPGSLKVGIQAVTRYALKNIRARGCSVSHSGMAVATLGVSVAPQLAGQTYDNFVVEDLVTDGVWGGIYAQAVVGNIGSFQAINPTFKNHHLAGRQKTAFGEQYVVGAGCSFGVLISEGSTHVADTAGTFTNGTNVIASGGGAFGTRIVRQSLTRNVTTPLLESGLTSGAARFGVRVNYTGPVWDAGGAVTVGNGQVVSDYDSRDGIITFRSTLTVGRTTSFPGGALTFIVPFAAAGVGTKYSGTCRIYDASIAGVTDGVAELRGASRIGGLRTRGGSNVTNGAPVHLAAGDSVAVRIVYAIV